MQFIDHKEFVTITLDLDEEVIIVYVAYLGAKMLIYLA